MKILLFLNVQFMVAFASDKMSLRGEEGPFQNISLKDFRF